VKTSGILVVDKPAGPTSHDVVDRVRRALGERRVGHTGTLDPFATGVLVVCVGQGTRLVRFLAEGDKVYRATVRLGFATSTDDLLGEALAPPRPLAADLAAVRAAAAPLTGALMQVPPAFSAKRVDGQRLYALARQGVAVERAPVAVTVHALAVTSLEGDRAEMEVRCSPGTYVRALARDLGERLGVGGHLVALRRTSSSGFGLEHALPADALDARAREALRPLSAVLTGLPAVTVGGEGLAAVRHGRVLAADRVLAGFPGAAPAARYRVLSEDGALLALAVPRGFDAADGVPGGPALQPDVVLVGE
jgi:tRNA pseudouridine55 synthase